MKAKRSDDNLEDDELFKPDSKRQMPLEQQQSSPSPVRLAFENSLLPLASYDGDDDEEEDVTKKSSGIGVREEENGKSVEVNGRKDDEEDDEDDDPYGLGFGKGKSCLAEVRKDCPYLDTVNRQVLDFDFERFCSVSLSNFNVYACLVCGKYYQGRGQKSHAYIHSLDAEHHIYINLQTEKVYCLPDGYEINDPSLDDIRHVLNPRYEKQDLHVSETLPQMVALSETSMQIYERQ